MHAFLSSSLPIFTHFNLLLQRDEPTIHLLKSSMKSLGKKLAKRIMLPEKIKDLENISSIDLNDSENFKPTSEIYLGVIKSLTTFMMLPIISSNLVLSMSYRNFHLMIHLFVMLIGSMFSIGSIVNGKMSNISMIYSQI